MIWNLEFRIWNLRDFKFWIYDFGFIYIEHSTHVGVSGVFPGLRRDEQVIGGVPKKQGGSVGGFEHLHFYPFADTK